REHEHEQERLQDRARDEFLERLAQDDEVAQEQRAERDACRGYGLARRRQRRRRGRDADGGHSRRAFPARLMNTVSSVGSGTERSDTSNPLRSATVNTTGRTPSCAPPRPGTGESRRGAACPP